MLTLAVLIVFFFFSLFVFGALVYVVLGYTIWGLEVCKKAWQDNPQPIATLMQAIVNRVKDRYYFNRLVISFLLISNAVLPETNVFFAIFCVIVSGILLKQVFSPKKAVNLCEIKNDYSPPPDDTPNTPTNGSFLSSLATMALVTYLFDDDSAKLENSSGLESSSLPDGPSENGFW